MLALSGPVRADDDPSQASSDPHVTARKGTVGRQDFNMDVRSGWDLKVPKQVTLGPDGQQIIVTSMKLQPPPNWSFNVIPNFVPPAMGSINTDPQSEGWPKFPPWMFVDVQWGLYGITQVGVLKDTATEVQGFCILPAEPTNAANFPLEMEGNLQPPSGSGGPGEPVKYRWMAKTAKTCIDLDVDSDNNNGLESLDQSPEEDQIENTTGDPAKPGKLLGVNDGDDNADGVPNYAEFAPVDPPQKHFVKAMLKAKEINLANAKLKLEYPSAENENTVDSPATTQPTTQPAKPRIRLWTKQSTETRNPASINLSGNQSGDFVPPGVHSKDAVKKLFGTSDTATLYVEGLTCSGNVADARLLATLYPDAEKDGNTDGRKMEDAVRLTIFKVLVSEVGFSGDGEHTLKKTGVANYQYAAQEFGSDGDTMISDPVWKDANLDGDVYDASDKNDPVCYTMGSTATLAAKLKISPNLTVAVPARVRIKQYDAEFVWLEKEVSLQGAELAINEPLQSPAPSMVMLANWMFIWQLSINGGPWCNAGKTVHLTFFTYGIPSGSAVTAKRMHWSTWRCSGGTTLQSDNIPRAMQYGVQTEGQGHFQGGDGLANAWSLFDPGVQGPCVTYAEVMKLGLQMLGVPQAKTTTTSVTSHPIATNKWLGENVDYSVLRWFLEWGSPDPWVNEGVCGVNTEDKGWLYYDVVGGSTYGPQADHVTGVQYATRPTGLVENQWREPVPSHGPIMKDWDMPPRYSNGIASDLPNYVKVKSPNGGEVIPIGNGVNVSFYTAGLQGLNMEVYCRNQATGVDTLIGTVTVAAAGSEAGNFSKETSLLWNTTGLPAGNYSIFVRLQNQTESKYYDWSDGTFELKP